jgi:hypothetical protein
MTSIPSSYPYTVLRLVGTYSIHLQFAAWYKVKIWAHPDGSYVAFVNFRLITPAEQIGFEATGATVEAALTAVVDRVDQAVEEMGNVYLPDLMEPVASERF